MLPVLHAERQLAAIEAASVPHITEHGRTAVLRRLQRLASGKPPAKAPKLLERLLAGHGARAVKIPKAGEQG